MNTVTSADGTQIAYERLGSGPPLLLVDGAMCSRGFGPMAKLATLLTDRFTVVHYDRRGRGDSGNTLPYAVEREIEDIAALVDELGGSAFVYGSSSGAVLAARAVASGVAARALVLHEPPLSLDGTNYPQPRDFRERIGEAVANDKNGDAVKTFLRAVGVPAIGLALMRLMPSAWRGMTGAAATLPYDFAVLGDTQSGGPLPDELKEALARIDTPTVLLAGTKSGAWMMHAARTVAAAIPGASVRELPGQMHNVSPKAIAPMLLEHCGDRARDHAA